jgi:cell shape-determining protein MreC
VQERIKELTHARHDERRSKEAVLREKQELERLTQQLIEENKSLKKTVNVGQEAFVHASQGKGRIRPDYG